MPVAEQRLPPTDLPLPPLPEVWLDFDERQKRRLKTTADRHGETIPLTIQLDRVTTPLIDGEVLGDAAGNPVVRIRAKPEPLLTASGDPATLMRAAYHLGNRHAKVELLPAALRTPLDPVMRQMLEQLGLAVSEVTAPFQPEVGAYHQHGHSHGHSHDEHHHHGHGQPKIHRFVMRP
ncbi:MAG TPA: urease accessory protein UreE [Candidatus Competibacter sp.]|nr:urease accessory protein UreE [Candidatus Competibacter sp.]